MFDPSAPHIIILLVVVLLLFGSTRLPGAAKALGQSMNIFKRSVKGLDDEPADPAKVTQGTVVERQEIPLSTTEKSQQQAQIDELARQVAELKKADGATTTDQQADTRSS
jgi:TatA/E family protein of Tat protein translocase